MSPDKISLDDLVKYTLIIATVAIVGGLMGKVLGGMQSNELHNVSVINNSPVGNLNFTTDTGSLTLAQGPGNRSYFIKFFNESMVVSNITDVYSIAAGNWTFSESAGTMVRLNGAVFSANKSLYNLSYVYQVGSKSRSTYGIGIDSISSLLDWLDEIALVISAVIILSAILYLKNKIDQGKKNEQL